MNLTPLTRILGLISSGVLFGSFTIYTIVYIFILTKYRLPSWKDISFLASQVEEKWFKLFTFCQILTFIAGIAFLILVCVFFSAAIPDNMIFAIISLAFSLMFILLSSEHYFVQLTYVRNRLIDGDLNGLESYTQLYSKSLIISKNILGWTLFFGVACLGLIPLFDDSNLGQWIKIILIANTVFCFLGFIGYSFKKMLLNILFFNGMGLCVIVFSLLTLFYLL